MRKVLAAELPAIDIVPQCTNPYECDFIDYCWRHILEHSVFDLSGRGVYRWDLYRRGIVRSFLFTPKMLRSSENRPGPEVTSNRAINRKTDAGS